MKKLINWFNIQNQDKKDHFYMGLIIGFPLVLTFGIYGGFVALAFALGLEVYQKVFKKGTFEIKDFVFTAIPIIMFILIFLISQLWKL